MQFIAQLFLGVFARKRRGPEFAGGHVRVRESDRHSRGRPKDRRQIVVFLGLQNVDAGGRSRSDDAHHFAPHQLFSWSRRFHLIANCDFVSGAQKPRDVSLRGVVGNSAHRHRFAFFAVAGGQSDLQFARRGDSVFIKQLVEVSQAKQHQRVRVPPLYGVVLPHQRCGWFSHVWWSAAIARGPRQEYNESRARIGNKTLYRAVFARVEPHQGRFLRFRGSERTRFHLSPPELRKPDRVYSLAMKLRKPQPEIEIKLHVPDVSAIRKRLRFLHAREISPRTHESNTLYDTPDEKLRRRGQLIRLRIEQPAHGRGRITLKDDQPAVLTFKGPQRLVSPGSKGLRATQKSQPIQNQGRGGGHRFRRHGCRPDSRRPGAPPRLPLREIPDHICAGKSSRRENRTRRDSSRNLP